MNNKIQESYKESKDIYDVVLTQGNFWSRMYIKIFWAGVNDNEIAQRILKYISNDFSGKLLDVPVGTGVFTCSKYKKLKRADITCVDYSVDMLEQAKRRYEKAGLEAITILQGDVGRLPFKAETFDVVLSMNGFHAFPDKESAYSEIGRVLKPGGKFIACFYIEGKSYVTDWLVRLILARKGWFSPPYETEMSLMKRLLKTYKLEEFHTQGSMVYFCAIKR